MDLMEVDDSYEPVPEPEPLFPVTAFMVAMLLIAWWIAKHHAGLTNPLWTYLTFSIGATGVGMLVFALWERNDWPGRIIKVVGFAVGWVVLSHVLQLGLDGKRDLQAEDLGVNTELAPGVITCQRSHLEQLGDEFSAEPYKQLGWETHYVYVVGGKIYHQWDYAAKPEPAVGTAIHVFYDVRQPERARLVTPADILPADAIGPVPAEIKALLPHPDPAYIAC